jgi:HSP20 family molecular chaperone IbpA
MTEVNELTAREKQPVPGEGTRPGPVFRPDIDVLEQADGFVVYADLPGVDEKSVDVRFDRGTLSLDARVSMVPDASWTPIHSEYPLGSYHREFRISDEIDVGAVSAKMSNGVLELRLPKSAEHQPREIPVQAG